MKNKISVEKIMPRAIIPNDSKLFAQADSEQNITHFVTSDSRSENIYLKLMEDTTLAFKLLPIEKPYSEAFGLLL